MARSRRGSGESGENTPAAEAAEGTGASTGKRYGAKEKQRILHFIAGHDEAHGRGGMMAASKKFGVNYRTLVRWSAAPAGAYGAGRPAREPDSVPAPRRGPGRPPRGGDDRALGALQRMAEIRAELQRLQAEYDRLRAQL